MFGPHFRIRLPQPLPELLTFSIFEQFPELFHGITTRHSEGKQPYDVGVQQVHGHDFIWVRNKSNTQKPASDAMLVDRSDITIRIGTSDCTPIMIYDAPCRRGGLIHAGFKGTTQEILRRVLRQVHARHTYIGIGPAIGPECYDQIDIQLENILQAQAAGVPLKQIEVMRWCTKCHSDSFFSYRAGDRQNFGTYFRLAKS